MKSKIWIGDMSEADKALAFKAVQKLDSFYNNKSLSENGYVGFFIEGSDITNLTNLRDKSFYYDDDEESTEITLQQLLKLAGMEENMSTNQFTKADLVEGMLITLRNGYTYTLKSCLNRMERAEGFMEMGDYLEDFTHKDACSGWDIVNIVYPTQVWKREEKSETQVQLEKLQQQIAELQAQANKLKDTL